MARELLDEGPPGVRGSIASGLGRAQPWLSTVVRLALAGVLLYSGYAKMIDLPASVRAVRAYRLLPEALVPIVGNGLPMLEMIVGFLLLVGLLTRASSVVTVLLMGVFVFGISSAWIRGLSIACGCFGGGGDIDPALTTYLFEILRDVGFIALAAYLYLWPRSRFSLDGALGLDPTTA